MRVFKRRLNGIFGASFWSARSNTLLLPRSNISSLFTTGGNVKKVYKPRPFFYCYFILITPTMSKELSKVWKEKLLGKTIVEGDQETTLSEGNYFRTSDLSQPNRVIQDGSPMTRDFLPDRLNVIYDEDNIAIDVFFA
ncbi:unnamed protein product [Rhizopus stolonifer]